MNDYLDQINVKGVLYTISGGTGGGVTSGDVQTMLEDYTYDKETIDDKISSGGGSSSAITVLSGDVITISGDVISLSGDVQNISGDVIVLSGDVQGLEGKLDALSGALDDKQDKLIAGQGISISDSNVISASGSVTEIEPVCADIVDHGIYIAQYGGKTPGPKLIAKGVDGIITGTDGITPAHCQDIRPDWNVIQRKLSAGTGVDITDNVISVTGGGESSGITSGEVQTMIDQSISGKADNDDLVTVSGDVIALSGIVINNEEVVARALNDLNDKKVESGNVVNIVSAYTYDKDTIDDKIASGGTFDPTQYYRKIETSGATELSTEFDKYYKKSETSGKTELDAEFDKYYEKTETSSKTELDDALLIDAYEDYRTKNTYTGAFPSLTGTADWNSAIQGGIYARHSTYWRDDSYEMLFKLQVIDENGNTFSAATRNIIEKHFTVDNVNPLPEYIDVVRPTYEESYYGRALASWIFKPKDGYRISYAEINSYWEDDFTNHNNINEVEWYDVFPSGYTKDIIENYIEPQLANAQSKLTFDDNVKLSTYDGKLVPYVPTDYNISDWYSGSTNPVQTQAVYKYTYSKAQIDAKIASGGGITSGDVLDIVSGYSYSKDEIDDNEQVVARALNDLNDKKTSSGDVVDIISAYTYDKNEIDNKIASGGGITSGDVVDIVSGYTYDKDEIDGKILDSEGRMLDAIDAAVSADTEDIKQDVAQLQLSAVTNAEYDSTAKTINFYNLTGGSVATIDATDFIKDGMLQDAEIVTIGDKTYLRLTFNAESGSEDVDLDLSQIFNANNYYTKSEVYSKVEVDNKFWCGTESQWSQISGSTQSGVLYLIY